MRTRRAVTMTLAGTLLLFGAAAAPDFASADAPASAEAAPSATPSGTTAVPAERSLETRGKKLKQAKKTCKRKARGSKAKYAKCVKKAKQKIQMSNPGGGLPGAPGGAVPTSVKVAGTDCPAFPADNYWNTPIASLPVNSKSSAWMASLGSRNLHPDFGPSYGEQSVPYGIPITVVDGSHARAQVRFDYDDESDHVAYPLGNDTLIEGGREAGGDRHTIVVDSSSCVLYETWDTHPGTPWTAGSGAVWNLKSNALRPAGWTSADAAGLPILPGLLTYEEVAAGSVSHAIRFTADTTRAEYLWPARHKASSNNSASVPPMGARFRIKSSFSLAGYSAQAKTVIRGMQQYGMVLADNGSDWYFQGTADDRWPEDLIDQLKDIPSSAFEAVETAPMKISNDSGQAR